MAIYNLVPFILMYRGEINPTVSYLYVLAQALGMELGDLVDVKMKK